MYKPIILPQAAQDIKEAASWYNAKQRGLGRRFTEQVREKLNFIKKNPKVTSVRYDNMRTSIVNIFPFMIHYSVDETKKQIVISAILHTSRNPDIWKER